jgi:ergothioneine biosynthesis protein EgtB
MLAAQNDVGVRQVLLERMAEARVRTDELFDIVKPEALYDRPIAERHRIVFYIGHLEAFDWNLLGERLLAEKAFHPEFDRLFAFGIDPVGGGLPTDEPKDWPSLAEVRNYCRGVRQNLDEGLAALRVDSEDARAEFPADLLLNVAIEHRLMHAETLAYMFHQLPIDQKVPQPGTRHAVDALYEPAMVEIPAGSATLGIARGDNGTYGWDNEYELNTVHVPGFAIDRYKVTNGQFLDFLRVGGYESRELWAEADWNWKSQNNISHPVFWKRVGDCWSYRAMFEEVPLRLDWPVYVSHAEASAYARWAGKALPSEAQWHRAAYGAPEGVERPYPWGSETPAAKHGNFDFQSWDPTPVSAFLAGQSAFGVADLVGNGWEWTSTRFGPFPGFEAFSFYPGYSANFFDGKHYVLKGGSARTADCMLRRSFRNWFQAHYQYVYAGFRCVRD